MGALHKSAALIGFYGDALDPVEISGRLGAEPTVGVAKGEIWYTSRGAAKVAGTGSWRIAADRVSPGDLDGQITRLLAMLTDELSVWRDLTARYRGVAFCGVFLANGNESLVMKPETLVALGTRGLILDLDIYGAEMSE